MHRHAAGREEEKEELSECEGRGAVGGGDGRPGPQQRRRHSGSWSAEEHRTNRRYIQSGCPPHICCAVLFPASSALTCTGSDMKPSRERRCVS